MSKDHADLRARIRSLAATMPAGAADWPQHRAAQFKIDLRAAHRAANNPMARRWVLEQALRNLERYHEPQSA